MMADNVGVRKASSEDPTRISKSVDGGTSGDTFSFEHLIQAISKNRLHPTSDRVPSSTKSDTNDFSMNSLSLNYSTDVLMRKIFEKAQEWENIRRLPDFAISHQKLDTTSRNEHIGPYTNDACPYDDVYMKEADECNAWKAFTFTYLFPAILLLAVLGNSLTLAVYRSRYLKSAATVLLLAVKAQANLAFACCLTVEMLHYFIDEGSSFQDVYWRSRPYTLFLANYFDSLAVWCTLAITLETYICVSFPMNFRRWSRRKIIYVVIVCLMIASGLLHVAYPITRDIELHMTCPPSHRYRMVIRDGQFYYDYERVYFFLHALAVISLPVLLMAIFSILIGYRFNKKPTGQRFSERRRCVIRITFATTLCTLILQSPGLIVFTSAAVRGSELEENLNFCTINVVTTFLTILNSAAPFLVYVCLNGTFRRLLFVDLGSRFVDCPFHGFVRRIYENQLRRIVVGEFTEHSCNVGHIQNANAAISMVKSSSNTLFDEQHMTCDNSSKCQSTRQIRRDRSSPLIEYKQTEVNGNVIEGNETEKYFETVRIIVEEVV